MASHSINPVLTQKFPFYDSMMSYINSYSTPGAHSKLIETCKEFFAKKPVVVVETIDFRNDEITISNDRKYAKIEVVKLSCKLWIKNSFNVFSNWNLWLSNIYRYENCHIFMIYSTLLM